MPRFRLLAPGFIALTLGTALLTAACSGSSYGSNTTVTQAPTAVNPSPTATAGGVLGTAPATTPAAPAATVGTADNAQLSKTILVDAAGMTLYTYANDSAGTSACTGGCAGEWPPLTSTGTPTATSGITGTLATITRSDGTTQVTYNGMPLYTWEGDQQPGDVTGNGVNSFHVAVP